MRTACHRGRADGLLLHVRLTPNAGRDEVTGVEAGPDGPLLKAKVRAIPDKGRANAALIATVAKWLRLPKTAIELESGATSRAKTLLIAGDAAELAGRIEAQLAAMHTEGERQA